MAQHCHGLCARMETVGTPVYSEGMARCSRCCVAFKRPPGPRCPCCGERLRRRAR